MDKSVLESVGVKGGSRDDSAVNTQGSISSTHTVTHNHLYPLVSGVPTPSSGPHKHREPIGYTDKHAVKIAIHIQCKKFLKKKPKCLEKQVTLFIAGISQKILKQECNLFEYLTMFIRNIAI